MLILDTGWHWIRSREPIIATTCTLHHATAMKARVYSRMCFVLLLALSSHLSSIAQAQAAGASRSEQGALRVLFWVTQGRSWKQQWDVQNELSDPCLDHVSHWHGLFRAVRRWIRDLCVVGSHSGMASFATAPATSSPCKRCSYLRVPCTAGSGTYAAGHVDA